MQKLTEKQTQVIVTAGIVALYAWWMWDMRKRSKKWEDDMLDEIRLANAKIPTFPDMP